MPAHVEFPLTPAGWRLALKVPGAQVMTCYVSTDGHWSVRVIILDGKQLLRITHDTVEVPGGFTVPSHWDRAHKRCGIVRMGDGYWVADVKAVTEVEQYVPLGDLTQANPIA